MSDEGWFFLNSAGCKIWLKTWVDRLTLQLPAEASTLANSMDIIHEESALTFQ